MYHQLNSEPAANYITGSFYGALSMTHDELRQAVQRVAEKLPDIMHDTGADAVAVTGSSGVSFAFALRMVLDVTVIVVRKPGESSHGSIDGINATWPERYVLRKYVFLDDLVASGGTLQRVKDALEPAVCVGVVLYDGLQRKAGELTLGGTQGPEPYWSAAPESI